MKYFFFTSILVFIFIPSIAQTFTISSPDKKIIVSCNVEKASYTVSYSGQPVFKESKLGLIRDDEDFTKNLKLIKASPPVIVKDNYSMLTAKKKNISYTAIKRVIETKTSSGKKNEYYFPGI
jgi:hypothetical protein